LSIGGRCPISAKIRYLKTKASTFDFAISSFLGAP
jgi:hypothetical protein